MHNVRQSGRDICAWPALLLQAHPDAWLVAALLCPLRFCSSFQARPTLPRSWMGLPHLFREMVILTEDVLRCAGVSDHVRRGRRVDRGATERSSDLGQALSRLAIQPSVASTLRLFCHAQCPSFLAMTHNAHRNNRSLNIWSKECLQLYADMFGWEGMRSVLERTITRSLLRSSRKTPSSHITTAMPGPSTSSAQGTSPEGHREITRLLGSGAHEYTGESLIILASTTSATYREGAPATRSSQHERPTLSP